MAGFQPASGPDCPASHWIVTTVRSRSHDSFSVDAGLDRGKDLNVRSLAQTGLGKSLAGGVVEQHPVFLTFPDGIDLQQERPLNLET